VQQNAAQASEPNLYTPFCGESKIHPNDFVIHDSVFLLTESWLF